MNTIEPVRDSHCSFCGTRFTEQTSWPRKCFRCYNDTYKNPIPIVVVLMRVWRKGTNAQCGWLIEQRNIEPKKGGWALPSGYVNFGETWQEAAAREVQEEIGLVTKPEDYELYKVVNATTGNMLIFCSHKSGVFEEQIQFTPNEEVSAIQTPILPEHLELCFPIHNELWKEFYYDND